MPCKPPSVSGAATIDLWEHELRAMSRGALLVAGVDEAGRGPLAGPVVAAAVILPLNLELSGINDSKKLTESAREASFARLRSDPRVLIGVGIVDADEIDRLNILQATWAAMRLALGGISVVDAVLVDGLPVPGLHRTCHSLVKGDSRSASIAAASIVAKVTRDRLMCGIYHERYPKYDFPRHKGYGTRAHLDALDRHGPCAIHRRSFSPVAQCAFRFTDSPTDDELSAC